MERDYRPTSLETLCKFMQAYNTIVNRKERLELTFIESPASTKRSTCDFKLKENKGEKD